MKKTLRNSFCLILSVLAFFSVGLLFSVTSVKAENEKSVEIKYCNLAFEDNVYILYAVDSVNIVDKGNVKLLIWRNYQDSYDYGTEDTVLNYYDDIEINEKTYSMFVYDKLSAKEMTDNVYARPYYNDNGSAVYGETKKYSILQYAYNKINNVNTVNSLKNLLEGMLNYGGLAQTHFNYKTDTLATDTYYQIEVENGTLGDGFNKGLFKENSEITLIPNTVEGKIFSHWEHGVGEQITTNTITVTKSDVYIVRYVGDKLSSMGLSYTLINNGTEYEVEKGTCTDTDIIIPSIHDGKPVTSIGNNAFWCCSSLSSIIIPTSVTSIGNYAFRNCSSLSSIIIPSSVTSIGNYAFESCSSLSSIIIPSSVARFGLGAFYNCSKLESVTFEENSKLVSVVECAFAGCRALSSIIIPSSVTSIGSSAFEDCRALSSIIIPSSVTSIGYMAFYNCSKLESVTFEENSKLESIWYSAFEDCSSLSSIVIPSSVTSIGERAFYYCSSLSSITYTGTLSQWQAISKGSSWKLNVLSTCIVHCTNGDINIYNT